MKNPILFSVLALNLFGLVGCYYPPTDDYTKDLQRQVDESKKQNDDLEKRLFKEFRTGGQPGQIKVSGIVVKDNTKVDIRITVLAQGGMGEDRTYAPVKSDYQPVFSDKTEAVDLSKVTSQKNLIAVGCDDKFVGDYSKDQDLEIQGLPAHDSQDLMQRIMTVAAKKVILCGNVDDLKYSFLTITADELILKSAELTQVGVIGSMSFSANKLVLIGANTIRTVGENSSLAAFSNSQPISLNVLSEIHSSEDGKLLIMSLGGHYIKEAN